MSALSDEPGRKKARRESLELARLKQEVNTAVIQNIHGVIELMTEVCPDWKEKYKDLCKQTIVAIKHTLSRVHDQSMEPLSILQVARALGHQRMTSEELDNAKLLARMRYGNLREDSSILPARRLEVVDGDEVYMDIYTEMERAMLEGVLADIGLIPPNPEPLDSDGSDK